MNRNVILFTFCAFIISITISCEKDYVKKDSTENESNPDDDDDNSAGMHEDSADYVWNSSDVIPIVLNGNSVSVNNAGVTVSGSVVTITSAGTYAITGTLTNGQVLVNTDDEETVRLILNGVDISCDTNAPVYFAKAKKVVVYLEEGTENTLTDAAKYVFPSADTDEPNAALYSKANMTIFGEGSLIVKGNYQDGIASKDGLILKGGNITVNAVDDGIRGKDYLIVKGAVISLKAGGDGMKSDNEESTSLGYITLTSDTISLVSGGDAISAQTKVLINSGDYVLTSGGGSGKTIVSTLSAKAIKAVTNLTINGGSFAISSADDGLHSDGEMTINDGSVIIASGDDGMKAGTSILINNGLVSISKSVEGIECPLITVNDGNISIVASDDGFNATKGNGGESNDGSTLKLNGGNIFVNASGGDGLDSNGSIAISGGTIIVHGPQSQPEVGMDYNGTCNVSGGFLVISGTSSNMTQAPSTTSSQYAVKVMMTSSLAANTLFHIQNANGDDVLTFKPVRNSSSIVFSSPALTKGSTYYIYTGGSSTGTNNNGLYQGGTYTAGTQYSSFTISSIITTLGSSSPGGRP